MAGRPNHDLPKPPIPETHTPPGGTPYHVKAGDSWVSLATGLGIDPWDLIDFNFPGTKALRMRDAEKAARQVNWYLWSYVGCRQESKDGQNWSFSSGLTEGKGVFKGGRIFLPQKTVVRPLPQPVQPPPAPRPPPPCEMSQPDYYRLLNPPERDLARAVFGDTLPPWDEIGIGNGLGWGGDPWTSDGIFIRGVDYPPTPNVVYAMNIGPVASEDLTSNAETKDILCGDYGKISELFIHEMTHIWQYKNDGGVMRSAIWARSPFGDGYEYVPGKAWNDYNKEQQASIVEHWHRDGQKRSDDRYPYIRLVIRSGKIDFPRTLTLAELKRDLDDLRQRKIEPLP